MAKESGIGMTVSIDNAAGSSQALTNDLLTTNVSTPRALQDITGLDKSAKERLQLHADANVAIAGVFNDAANKSHAVLSTVTSSAVARTVAVAHSGQTLSNEMFGTDYQLQRAADGSIGFSSTFVLQDGTVPTWA